MSICPQCPSAGCSSSPETHRHALAEAEGATLIVVGSSHRSAIGRILVGGTGERLLSGAPAPVAVAPAGYAAPGAGIRTVGCGFDGSRESHRALAWAAELARTTSARLRVRSVYEPTLPVSLALGGGLPTASINEVLRRQCDEELAQTMSALDADIEATGTLLDGDAQAVFARESAGLDLLVVGSRGYGPLRAVLLGSVFERPGPFGPVAAGGRSARRGRFVGPSGHNEAGGNGIPGASSSS